MSKRSMSTTTSEPDALILADAVNQLAIAIEEYVLPLTRSSGLEVSYARGLRVQLKAALRHERERMARIIERHDP